MELLNALVADIDAADLQLAASGDTAAYQRYQEAIRRENDFVKLVMATREELQKLYDDPRLSDAAKLRRKAEIFEGTRSRYAKLNAAWGAGKSGYDEWFARPINNAQLNTVAAYYELVPAFQSLLRAQGGDMEKFFQAARALSKLPLEKRHEALRVYLTPNSVEKQPGPAA